MNKNVIWAIPALALSSMTVQAAASESVHTDLYYAGRAQILNLLSGASSGEDVIFERIVDSDAGMISELACVKDDNGHTEWSPVYMKVTGNSLKIADSQDVDHPNKVQGTGTVYGDPWNSKYLTFSMTAFGAHVQDANFLVGNMLVARKQIFLADGTPLELYDINAAEIDEASYQTQFTAMGCASAPH